MKKNNEFVVFACIFFNHDLYLKICELGNIFIQLEKYYEILSELYEYQYHLTREFFKDILNQRGIDDYLVDEVLDSLSNEDDNFDHYFKIYLKEYNAKKINSEFTKFRNGEIDDVELQKNIENKLLTKEYENNEDTFDNIYEQENFDKPYETVRIGREYFDKNENGLRKGELIIIAARTSLGKTSEMKKLALNNIIDKYRVGIISGEMSKERLSKDMLATIAEVSKKDYASGKLWTDDLNKIQQAKKEMKPIAYRLEINDKRGIDIDTICKIANKWKKIKNIDILYIDYLQILEVYGMEKKDLRIKINYISSKLQTLAGQLNIPVVVLAQLSRNAENRDHPQLRDLKECLPKGQLVYSDGKRIPIEKCKKGMSVVSYGQSWKLQNDIIKDIWEVGIKKIYEVKTELGRTLKCTDNHKFFASTYKKTGNFSPNQKLGLQGWTELKDLKIGQKIAVVKKYPDKYIGKENKLKCLLLGLLIGDGHITKTYYSSITTNTYNEAKMIQNISRKEFNLECTIKKYPNCNAYNISLSNIGRSNITKKRKDNNLRRWLKNYKINQVSKYKEVPNFIFSESNKNIACFLKGLFHADGSISLYANKRYPMIKITLISYKLIQDIKHLLLRFGIIAKEYYNKPREIKNNKYVKTKTSSESWTLTITGSNLLKYKKYVGFCLEKQKKMYDLLKNYNHKDKIKKSDILFDRIKSIRYLGEEMTYDIEVRGHHSSNINNSFCVNDILTHNSGKIEEDADVVILMSVEQWVDDNHLKVILRNNVAKNRNGATGVYYTKFNRVTGFIQDCSLEEAKGDIVPEDIG